MAQTSPILGALLIIVVLIAIILLVMVLISRRSTITTSSTNTNASCIGPPSTPSGLIVTNPQGDLIIFNWNDIAGAEEYTAYIGNTPSFSVQDALAVRTVKFSSASFANLTLGVTYYLKVFATNVCGNSPLSPEVSFNLVFQFPERFKIVNRSNSALGICDFHDNIYAPGDEVYSIRFCSDLGSWSFYNTPDHTIRQSDRPGYCLTRTGPDVLYFSPCVPTAAQQWTYNSQDNTLCSFANSNTGCLRTPIPLPQDGGLAHWGPKVADAYGDWDFEPV